MAITSGIYYFGPSESLLDISACAAQVSNQTLVGDVTFIQTGTVFVNSQITFSCIMAGHNLRITSNESLNGDPTKNIKIILEGGINNYLIFNVVGTSGLVQLDNLYFITSGTGGYVIWIDSNTDMIIRDSLFKKLSISSGYCVTISSSVFLKMYNLKIWSYVSSFSVGANSDANAATIQFENISQFTKSPGGFDITNILSGSNKWIKNCISYAQSYNYPSFVGSVSAISNATGDGALSASFGNFSSIIPMNHFITSSDTSSDFLNLNSTSFLISAGSSSQISINTYGIRTNSRPGDAYYSIGADEYGEATIRFVADKRSGTIPFYLRLTDTSDLSQFTSVLDYTRIWSIRNTRTSATEYLTSTSASINYCISASSILYDTYTVSLSAVT